MIIGQTKRAEVTVTQTWSAQHLLSQAESHENGQRQEDQDEFQGGTTSASAENPSHPSGTGKFASYSTS